MNHNLTTRTHENGAADTWLVVGVAFIVTTVLLAAGLTWALINYFDQKNTVDTQVSSAVTIAVKKQADADAATFEAEDKKPNRQFAGPEDFGSVSFQYPKTWSTYVDSDASSGTYEAYLNPVVVPPVGSASTTQYALRVTIETKDYDSVLSSYESSVKKGDLKSSTVKINGNDSTRLDGNFTKDIRGSAVILKIRDKTVTIRTDADTFKADFASIVASIKYNQ
jgi:biopolymer transport protein ExbD